jgi:hypothetical protein
MSKFMAMLAERYGANNGGGVMAEEWLSPTSLPVRQQKALSDLTAATKGKLYMGVPTGSNTKNRSGREVDGDLEPVVFAIGDLSKTGAVAEITDAAALKPANDGNGVRLTPDVIAALYNNSKEFAWVDVSVRTITVGLNKISAGEMRRPTLASTGGYFDFEAERAANMGKSMRRGGKDD